LREQKEWLEVKKAAVKVEEVSDIQVKRGNRSKIKKEPL